MNNIVPNNKKKGCEFVLNEIPLEGLIHFRQQAGTNLLKCIFVKWTTKTWYNPCLLQLFNPLLQDNRECIINISDFFFLVTVLENAGERERISYFGQLTTQKSLFATRDRFRTQRYSTFIPNYIHNERMWPPAYFSAFCVSSQMCTNNEERETKQMQPVIHTRTHHFYFTTMKRTGIS